MTPGFLLDQEDLHSLCRDRPLVTPEIHEPNDFYGQAAVLKKYSGFPDNYPLRAVLEHGLVFDDRMWDVDRFARLPLFFSNSMFRSEIHRRETGKPSIPIGFGYLYAMANFNSIHGVESDRAIREGTVVFPSHSTHHIKAVFDHAGYAKKLNELPDKYKPITACMYWKDFLHGHHSFYEKEGFRIVTAGHIYDPDFLYRFYDICRQFKYSTSNNIGGHLFYSVKSGCSFFYTPSNKINHEVHADVPLGGFTSMSRMIKERMISLFSEPKETMDHEQMKFVDEYIGTAHFKNGEELGDLFRFAEKMDKAWNKTGIPGNAKSSSLVSTLPTYWQRKLFYVPSHLLKAGSKIRKSLTGRGE